MTCTTLGSKDFTGSVDVVADQLHVAGSATGLVVKSVTDRFSVGTKVGTGRSTYLNEDLRWNVSPGVEFNVFPYSESSRRALTLQALMNVRHWDYQEETIFFRDAETRVAASLSRPRSSRATRPPGPAAR